MFQSTQNRIPHPVYIWAKICSRLSLGPTRLDDLLCRVASPEHHIWVLDIITTMLKDLEIMREVLNQQFYLREHTLRLERFQLDTNIAYWRPWSIIRNTLQEEWEYLAALYMWS